MPQQLATSDLNGDGVLDIVTLSAATSEVAVYFGSAGSDYEEPIAITLPEVNTELAANPMQIILADWNGDGMPDILVYDSANSYWQGTHVRIHIYLNNGAAGFFPAPDTPIQLSAEEQGGILAIADFTADGLADIVVGTSIYGKDRFLGYTRLESLSLGQEGWYAASGVTADFNEDGRPDLAVATSGYYLLNPGTVLFLSTPTGLGPPIHPQYEYLNGGSIAAGDFTGDGHADLAILHDYYRNSEGVQDGNVISLLIGDGSGSLIARDHQLLGRRGLGLVGSPDLNRDGQLDLLLMSGSSSWLLLGDGHGSFSPATPNPVPLVPGDESAPTSLSLVDTNRDGFDDVVFSQTGAHEIRFSLNNQQGSLLPAPYQILTGVMLDSPSNSSPGARAFADVNSDGQSDLLVLAGQNPKQLFVFLNSPTDSLRLHSTTQMPGTTVPWSGLGWIVTGDINNDQILDVVAGAASLGVVVLLGDGSGNFVPTSDGLTPVVDLGEVDTYHPGTLADLNQDGNLDLMVVQSASSNSYGRYATGWFVFFGDGTGKLFFNKNTYLSFPPGYGFPPPPPYIAPNYPAFPPALHDYDGDGKIDLLVANVPNAQETTHITVYKGRGNGTFVPGSDTVQVFSHELLAFVAGDFNHDGFIDALGYSASALELLIGDGTGHFTALPGATQPILDVLSGSAMSRVEVADANGDGALDVLVTPLNQPYLAVCFNDGTGHFPSNSVVPVHGSVSTVQPTSDRQWVDAGMNVIVPTLWPTKLSETEILASAPTLSGTAAPNSHVVAYESERKIGQASVGADGQWIMPLASALSEGLHSIQVAASSALGETSAISRYVITAISSPYSWHNARSPLDVNDDGDVSPLDALLVINYLNTKGVGPVPPNGVPNGNYLDTSKDNAVFPFDALLVINYLNRGSGEGEAEHAAANTSEPIAYWSVVADTAMYQPVVAASGSNSHSSWTVPGNLHGGNSSHGRDYRWWSAAIDVNLAAGAATAVGQVISNVPTDTIFGDFEAVDLLTGEGEHDWFLAEWEDTLADLVPSGSLAESVDQPE